jgi:hypothetical protein
MILSQRLSQEVLSCGSADCAHFAVLDPKTGLIQAYFLRKGGLSR